MASDGVHDGASAALAQLGHSRTVQLQTRKRDGTWVPSPVSLVIEGDRAYFRTYDTAGKYKRLRNFPQVRLAAASRFRGKPTGPAVEGRVRVLDGAEAQHAGDLLAARFPLLQGKMVPWMHRRKGWATIHYEVTFDR